VFSEIDLRTLLATELVVVLSETQPIKRFVSRNYYLSMLSVQNMLRLCKTLWKKFARSAVGSA